MHSRKNDYGNYYINVQFCIKYILISINQAFSKRFGMQMFLKQIIGMHTIYQHLETIHYHRHVLI
jgi:hypothetical protein